MTIPYLYPPDTNSSSPALADPYQSIGSRGVNNLASKFLLVTLPSQRGFFQYRLSPDTEVQIKQLALEERDNFDRALMLHERYVLRQVDDAQLRPIMFMCFKHLLVSGNVLLHVPNEGPARYFPLTHFVCKRDPSTGSPLEIIVREEVDLRTMPQEVQDLVETSTAQEPVGESATHSLYTYVCLKPKKGSKNTKKKFWYTWQEIDGVRIPGSDGFSPENDPKWFPLRMIRVSGEHYGRGYLEEYAGELSVC